MTDNLLASLVSGSGIPVKRHGVSGFPSGGGAVPIDDTDLKCYWKFNETSGNIINQSESDESLGSGADLESTGGTYDNTSSPFGYGFLLDGVNDYLTMGSSVSQNNYWHNTSAKVTFAFWLKVNNLPSVSVDFVLGDVHTDDQGAGLALRINTNGNLNLFVTNASAVTTEANSGDDFIPDESNWYFYCISYDVSPATNNVTFRRNDGNQVQVNKGSGTPTNGNSSNAPILGKNIGGSYGYLDGIVTEFSTWNSIITGTQTETSLYNNGSGSAIY